jgi:hypothetical protein
LRLLAIVSLALAVIVAVLTAVSRPDPGPERNFRPLRDWFREPDLGHIFLMPGAPAGPGREIEAYKVMLEVGGDAVPFLSKAAKRRPGFTRQAWFDLYRKLPSGFQRAFPKPQPPDATRQEQTRAITLLGSLTYWDRNGNPFSSSRSPFPNDVVISTLQFCLHDPNMNVRVTAATACGYLGRPGAQLIPDLTNMVYNGSGPERIAAASALAGVGNREVVPHILTLLPKDGGEVPLSAIDALARLGPEASSAVPALLEMLPHAKNHVQMRIADAFGMIGVNSPEVRDALVNILKSPDVFTRRYACLAMVRLGTTPESALPWLAGYTNAQNHIHLRQTAALALWNHAPQDPQLIEAVTRAMLEQPQNALVWLSYAHLRGRAKPLIPLLESLKAGEAHMLWGASNLLYQAASEE